MNMIMQDAGDWFRREHPEMITQPGTAGSPSPEALRAFLTAPVCFEDAPEASTVGELFAAILLGEWQTAPRYTPVKTEVYLAAGEPCIHDLDAVSCAVCNGADKRAEAERPERGPWFSARYDGTCSGCVGEFEAGEKIRADGEGGYLCGDCGDEP